MKAPFPWFGGKRRVAPDVWAALGDVDHYVEPFAGSLAVLLERPTEPRTETVNDADAYVCNVWRAITADPDAVADAADWPVNETDLFARHLWLVNEGRDRMIAGLEADPDWYDAQIAGWWLWGIASWIGSGWCTGDGPWCLDPDGGRPAKHDPSPDRDTGVSRRRPHLGNTGQGVNRTEGVSRQLPSLGSGQGVNRLTERAGIHDYMGALAARLRHVRVCNGDWSRIVTPGALTHGATVGVFLDPPYLGDVRNKNIYACDDYTIANDVRDWCLANGDNPRYRIVLAGYEPEHDHLIPDTWRRIEWSASVAYSTAAAAARQDGTHINRHLERLWLSPGCLTANTQPSLFDEVASIKEVL